MPGTTGEIRIGILVAVLGVFEQLGNDGIRGIELAVAEFGEQVAGKKIKLVVEATNAIPDYAQDMAQRLIEEEGVDFIIGPLSGNEALAIRDFAKYHKNRVFINGAAGAQDLTVHNPAPNFYSFFSLGTQFIAGLGQYAFETQGYRRVVTIGEDYSFPHAQVGAFTLEFCQRGGQIIHKFWVPLGTRDYSDILSHIPAEADAVLVALGGHDAVNFLHHYQSVPDTKPVIGGSLTADQTVLSTGDDVADLLLGMVTAGPTADDNPLPQWQQYVNAYRKRFSDGLSFPSLSGTGYYINTKATLLALQEVGGDLSNGQARFKEALARLHFDGPTGPIRLDHTRQAIINNFVTAVARDNKGNLYRRLIKTIPEVPQTLGFDEAAFLRLGTFTADNPRCTPDLVR